MRWYFKVCGVFYLRAFHASYFCIPPAFMYIVQVSDFVLMYLTWSQLFPSGVRYILNISIASSDFISHRGNVVPSLVFAVKVFRMPRFVHFCFSWCHLYSTKYHALLLSYSNIPVNYMSDSHSKIASCIS